MGFFDALKQLVVAGRDHPGAHAVPARSGPEPEQHQCKKPATPSNADVEAVTGRAKTLQLALNDALTTANQATDRETRERELHAARDRLAELKRLATEFAQLRLSNLEAVEVSLRAIDAEPRSLSGNEALGTDVRDGPDKGQLRQFDASAELSKPIDHSRTSDHTFRLSEREKDGIRRSTREFLGLIRNYVENAKTSENLQDKAYRLSAARNTLEQAHKMVRQRSRDIGGLEDAEDEIARLDRVITATIPIEVAGLQPVDVSIGIFSTPARILLKEATALKKKKYLPACDKLREAYAAEGAGNLMIEERLRLPMYLQLAGKNDAGWNELNRLAANYADPWSQAIIAKQRKIFLRKENNETGTNPVRGTTSSQADSQIATFAEAKKVLWGSGATEGEMQNKPLSSWGNEDVIKGLEFSATLQLRTPLRVLLRHGEMHTDRNMPPPKICLEPWEGGWFPRTKTFRELGIDADEPGSAPGLSSDSGDYLRFLIAVRRIVETYDTIEHRIEKLREMPIKAGWQEFFKRHGGMEGIVETFFPKFCNLPKELDTPNRIAAASDQTLLGVKGIGPAKLKALRERCARATENRDSDRVDNAGR